MMDFQARRNLVLKATAQAEIIRVKSNVSGTETVDPIDIAEQRGCDIRFMSLPSLEGIYSPEPRPTIVLGSERPAGRRAFTCAHELGHHEFKHGMRVEKLNTDSSKSSEDSDEFLADVFAGILLMPKAGIHRALKARHYELKKITPIQLFRLASFFGVGYTTLIVHMTWTLSLLDSHHGKRMTVAAHKILKEIKKHFGGESGYELVLTDEAWSGRAIDLEVGDTLVLLRGAVVESGKHLQQQGIVDGQPVFKVVARGYSRAYSKTSEWAANIRIAPKHYEGLAQYRFLDDPEEHNT